ncbi:MAG: hypothetical protein BA865_10415 [Desulfobacterales bacterium S5133MH4]|nr:MAG: hypothetical protein BA865_10415 [Desulfobacterales bacterium S5133MH4]
MKIGKLFVVGAALLVCLSAANSAWPHKVHVFAWVEGDTVYTESYFSDGNRAVHAKIEVFDSYGKLILAGETDEEGNFSFKLPACTDLRIVLNASEGHEAEFNLSVEQAD